MDLSLASMHNGSAAATPAAETTCPSHGSSLHQTHVTVQGVEMDSELDFDELAELTAGYSGDDITNVCRDAAMNGMRRKIQGKTPEQIRQVSTRVKRVNGSPLQS